MQGSQAEMYVALFNWSWVLQSEAELLTDNVMDEVNLANVVNNIHERRLKYVNFPSRTSGFYL